MGSRHIFLVIVLFGCGVAAAKVPLPRPRPPSDVLPISFNAGADFDLGSVSADPTPCDRRLAGVAAIEPLPRLIGPGACGGADMVELDAVLLQDGGRVAVEPAAVLNCTMAEAVSGWLREDAAPALARLGSPLRAVENYDSYECRSRNRVVGA
jgi:hypothetical protein